MDAHRSAGAVLAWVLGVVAAFLSAASAWGQTQRQEPTPIPAAAEVINAATIARHVAALTTDSLSGRATPSPALEAAARYVADQFQRLGLQPFGDKGDNDDDPRSWFRRYPLPGQLRFSYANSKLQLEQMLQYRGKAVVEAHGEEVSRPTTVDFVHQARLVSEIGPPVITQIRRGLFGEKLRNGDLTLLTGPQTAASIAAAELADKSVLYVPPTGTDSVTEQAVLKQLYVASTGVVLVREIDSTRFAARLRATQQPIPLVDRYLQYATPWEHKSWVIELRADAIRDWLQATGVDLTEAVKATKPSSRALAAKLSVAVRQDSAASPRTTAPDVVGLVEGADSVLKQQYIIVSAHLDGTDNTAGIAALLALTEALRRPGAQPRRSVIVVATSGSVDGLWGSQYFANFIDGVADLTLNLTGPGTGDSSVILDGSDDVALEPSPAWLLAAHPELALTLRPGGTVTVPSGDHFAFVQHAIPSLYLHDTDASADSGARVSRRSGPPPALGAAYPAYAARVARFAFYLTEEMASGRALPHWTTVGRRRFATVVVP